MTNVEAAMFRERGDGEDSVVEFIVTANRKAQNFARGKL